MGNESQKTYFAEARKKYAKSNEKERRCRRKNEKAILEYAGRMEADEIITTSRLYGR